MVPVVTALTRPEVAMVATPVVVLLQDPPGVASLNAVVAPAHDEEAPVIGESAFTVSVRVAKQPPGIVYEMTGVPAATPLISPEDDPADARAVLLLVHMPPDVEFVSVTD